MSTRGLLLAVAAMLLGCGATQSPAGDAPGATGAAGAEPSAGEQPAPAPVESERDRRVRLAKAKRQQCQALGDVIEKAQQHDTIVNVNDVQTLRRVAKELTQRADDMTAIQITTDQLGELRDEYAAAMRQMAQALTATAAAMDAAEQNAALERFRSVEKGLAERVQQMVDVCNAPVE